MKRIRRIAASLIQSRLGRREVLRRRSRVQTRNLDIDSLESRLMLSADLLYPSNPLDALVTDLTLVAETSGSDVFLRLRQTSNLSNILASVQLDDAGDFDVNIKRDDFGGGSTVLDLASDTVRVDLDTFALLNTFVSGSGGVLDLDFDGGTEIPLVSDDHFRVEGTGTFSVGYALALHSTSDVTINTGFATFAGDVTVKSDDEIKVTGSSHIAAGSNTLLLEAKATDDEGLPGVDGLLFTANSAISVDSAGVTLEAGNITLRAQSAITITNSNFSPGSVNIAFAIGISDASIIVSDGTLNAINDLTIEAISTVSSTLTTVPDDAEDDDDEVDAAVASAILHSTANVLISGCDLDAGDAVQIKSNNTVNASTTADGLSGDSGGTVAVNVFTGDTTAIVSGGSVDVTSVAVITEKV